MQTKGLAFTVLMIILTMMSMMGLLASDIYIPGLKVLTGALQATPYQIQLTIGIYLLGLAAFQLVYGPLSDRFGRKPVIMAGFVIYIIASFCAACSQTILQLILLRFFQSLGACAGLVVGRAIIADLFDKQEAPRVYNIIYPLVAASPAIAPLIGGYLIDWVSWRLTFVFVGFFGIVLFTLTAFFLKESLQKNVRPINVVNLFFNYYSIIKHYRFWSYVIPVFTLYSAWFIFITQSSFLYSELHYTTEQIGYFYIPLAIFVYLGNLFCKKMRKLRGGEFTFILGLIFFCLGGFALMSMSCFTEINYAWQYIVPMCMVTFANGIILPLGMAFSIGLKPEVSGSASGVVGFLQIGFSALSASFCGRLFGISGGAMSIEIVVLALVALLSYFGCYYFSGEKVGRLEKI